MGIIQGTTIGLTKEDTRSLDYSSSGLVNPGFGAWSLGLRGSPHMSAQCSGLEAEGSGFGVSVGFSQSCVLKVGGERARFQQVGFRVCELFSSIPY